jgi:hypothetical protein
MRETVSIAIRHLPKIGLEVEELVLHGSSSRLSPLVL